MPGGARRAPRSPALFLRAACSLIHKGLCAFSRASGRFPHLVGIAVALIGALHRISTKACSEPAERRRALAFRHTSNQRHDTHKEAAMPSHSPDAEPASRVFDVTRRYVRVRERRDDGFVEFDFSIGDPGLSVELVMSAPDYESFCATHHVFHLSDDEAEALDLEQLKWRYGQPGLTE